MSVDVRVEVQRLLGALGARAADPAFTISSSLSHVYESQEYRELIALGPAAIPWLIREIGAGNLLLSGAVMQIAGMTIDRLGGLPRYPGLQAVSTRILEWWNEVIARSPVTKTVEPVARTIQRTSASGWISSGVLGGLAVATGLHHAHSVGQINSAAIGQLR